MVLGWRENGQGEQLVRLAPSNVNVFGKCITLHDYWLVPTRNSTLCPTLYAPQILYPILDVSLMCAAPPLADPSAAAAGVFGACRSI